MTLWEEVRSRITAGDYPPVFVSADGRLVLAGRGATLPPDIAALYPAAIRQAAEARAAERQAAERARQEAARAERQAAEDHRRAIIDALRFQRVWRLSGLFAEHMTPGLYTWQEISDWVEWDAWNLRHADPCLAAVVDVGPHDGFCVDLSQHFRDAGFPGKPAPSFAALAARLDAYVAMRRENSSPNN